MVVRRATSLNKLKTSLSEEYVIISIPDSKFECLPNEILCQIFEYLSYNEIFDSFENLNKHFQIILQTYSFYHFNLSNIKTPRTQLKSIENIKYLTLCPNLHSVIDAEEFFSIYSMDLFFNQLESLIIKNFTEGFLRNLIANLKHFRQLKCLSLSSSESSLAIDKTVRNRILFEIPTLKYFQWQLKESFFNVNYTEISQERSSIECFQFSSLRSDQFEWLYLHTFNLKSLSIDNLVFASSPYRCSTFDRLIRLNLNNVNSNDRIHLIFKHFKTLTKLKSFELRGEFIDEMNSIDGYQLENLLQTFVPQLKIFRFFFAIYSWTNSANVEDFIESFSTDFWLIEKQWFISLNYQIDLNKLYFYTEPCIENQFTYSHSWTHVSTKSTVDSLSNIRQITFDSIDIKSIENPSFRLMNIRSLVLNNIPFEITFDVLNQFADCSSIEHLEFHSKTNPKLLFDFLEFHSTSISLTISLEILIELFENPRNPFDSFRKITMLKVIYMKFDQIHPKQFKYLPTYFPNIEVLHYEGDFKLTDIAYLIGSLRYLSLISIDCLNPMMINNESILYILKKQNTKFKKTNLTYRCSKKRISFYLTQ